MRIPGGRWRIALPVLLLAAAGALVWWRGPDWHAVSHAFAAVSWRWVVAAIAFNLVSVLARAASWNTTIHQALPSPRPRFSLVFSAFSVGLFANAVLPGRVGELARVGVLTRRMPGRQGAWATLVGSVFAHRMFDLIPAFALVVWVLLTANIPHWALFSLALVLGVGFALFTFAWLTAKRQHTHLDGLGTIRTVVARARVGLAVMRNPTQAALAASFQLSGWICQLFAVWCAMRAFDIREGLSAAGLVLVLVNVATIFPLWPGNVGLVQAAVALPLVNYGVKYAQGFAFGLGLQAIEASVGVGVGLIFLAREGLSYATLKELPDATDVDLPSRDEPETERRREGAGVPG